MRSSTPPDDQKRIRLAGGAVFGYTRFAMDKPVLSLLALLLAAAAAPANAGPSGFSIVNATGRSMDSLTIRRFGSSDWRPLGSAPSPGARASLQFNDPDCAFDIQASLQGIGTVVWSGVNLCEVKAVILNRNDSGALWVDYE